LEELTALERAETVEDLWRVLVTTHPYRDTAPRGAASLLTKHHGNGQPGALDTALLLCTYRMWERCTHRLIQDIVGTGLLSGDDLDRLAAALLSGDTIGYDHPANWYGPVEVEIDLKTWSRKVRKIRPGERTTTERRVQPPLRGWAAAHRLRRQPESLASLLDQARCSRPPMAAATVNGMLHSIGVLPPDEAALLLEVGLAWPIGSVRLRALEALAAQGEVEEAARRAATDPDAKVRGWRPRGAAFPVGNPEEGGGLQESLFDNRVPE
jgi:hypothetical protein